MIEYRIARESDYQSINDFHNRLYGTHRTLEQFYWEFHNAPAGKSVYIIALDREIVVGTQCIIPTHLATHSRERILSGKSEATLVDPTFRGQNIFNQMYDMLFEECSRNHIKVIWGFTSAVKAFSKMGFECPFEHQQVLTVNQIISGYCYLSSLNPKNRIADKLRILGLSIASKILFIVNLGKSIPANCSVDEEPITDISDLQSLNLAQDKRNIMIDHSPEYLKWRIYDNPNYFKVHTFTLRNLDGKLLGVIFLNSTEDSVYYVIDCLFSPELTLRNKASFIADVTRRIFSYGAILVRNWTFDHNEYNENEALSFRKAGYIKISRGISLVWKKMADIPYTPEEFLLSRLATQGAI
jgi:hypothetical protein